MAGDEHPSDGTCEGVHAVRSVALLTPVWGRSGGVATHVKASATALAAHGIDVHVLAARIHSDVPVAGVTLHDRPDLLNPRAPLPARLGAAISVQPDVFHIHQVDDLEMTRALRQSAPVVTSAHGYPGCTSGVHYFAPGEECPRAHGPGCIPNLIARGCAHTRHRKTLPLKYLNVSRGLAALAACDLAVSYSATIDRHLAANGLRRRAIVPLFPTLEPGEPPGAPARQRVLFAGRVEPAKGVDVLLRAAGRLDCELVICGEGRQLPAMRALAERLGLRGRVRFAGWLEPAQLALELAAATVVAVPSLWPEPFGLVGIEALALGRPVVASATGGIGDWLTDDVGVGVRPGDADELAAALRALLEDPDRGREMGAAGRRLVAERFSPERHVQRLLEAYREARSAWGAQAPAALTRGAG
ncbi:MAG TPA: glycosyltransferase [Solirubrobacteraceae bacterium]|jgi:glycosyltransferase involved in cell wall biosynthesis|nr:glycosyltransferase [Solirubrobacteraceae bacterium]